MKGTWDRGGLGLRPPPPGSTPRRGPPAGAKQSPPTTYGRDGSRALDHHLWCGFYETSRERTGAKEINPTARTGERCSASQYVNKLRQGCSACKALAHSWHAAWHKPRSVVLASFSHCTIALHQEREQFLPRNASYWEHCCVSKHCQQSCIELRAETRRNSRAASRRTTQESCPPTSNASKNSRARPP